MSIIGIHSYVHFLFHLTSPEMSKGTLYYSNHCAFSRDIIEFVTERGLTKYISFVCVDNRHVSNTGMTTLILDNGQRVSLPVHIHTVPALDCLVNQRYNTTVGGLSIKEVLVPGYSKTANALTEVGQGGLQPATSVTSALAGLSGTSTLAGSKYVSGDDLPSTTSHSIRTMPLDYTPGQSRVREGDDAVKQLELSRAELIGPN